MLFLAADHAGFELKEKIKAYLLKHQIPFKDMGAFEFDKDDDYPDFGRAAALEVSKDPERNRAILICGSGAGMSITANKVKAVYCAQVWQRDLARNAREHNNVNAIALGARYISEEEAILSVAEFLKADGKTEERHDRRFKKIQQIESTSLLS
ncbi:MAG: RpiB/LacA/LacB family sugar-phosphate isomerase [Patescibacteria group bacterium]